MNHPAKSITSIIYYIRIATTAYSDMNIVRAQVTVGNTTLKVRVDLAKCVQILVNSPTKMIREVSITPGRGE